MAVLWLVNKRINPAYKLAWTILILSIPVVGACVYLLFGKSRMAREMERSFANATWASRHLLKEEETGRRELERRTFRLISSPSICGIIRAFRFTGIPGRNIFRWESSCIRK